MSNLSAFLKQNAIRPENRKLVVSQRFVGEDGTPIPWEARALDAKEDKAIKKDCTRKVPVPGKKNMLLPELDIDKYQVRLMVACTVFPNLNDQELQDSYGAMGADALIDAMLLPGEQTDYVSFLYELNGFDNTIDQKVEEAKN